MACFDAVRVRKRRAIMTADTTDIDYFPRFILFVFTAPSSGKMPVSRWVSLSRWPPVAPRIYRWKCVAMVLKLQYLSYSPPHDFSDSFGWCFDFFCCSKDRISVFNIKDECSKSWTHFSSRAASSGVLMNQTQSILCLWIFCVTHIQYQ